MTACSSPSTNPKATYTKVEISSDEAEEDWEKKYSLMKNERDMMQQEMEKVSGKVFLMARSIETFHRKSFLYQARLQRWSRVFKAPLKVVNERGRNQTQNRDGARSLPYERGISIPA